MENKSGTICTVFVRSVKITLVGILCSGFPVTSEINVYVSGYDLIEWLMDRLCIEDSRKYLSGFWLVHTANTDLLLVNHNYMT